MLCGGRRYLECNATAERYGQDHSQCLQGRLAEEIMKHFISYRYDTWIRVVSVYCIVCLEYLRATEPCVPLTRQASISRASVMSVVPSLSRCHHPRRSFWQVVVARVSDEGRQHQISTTTVIILSYDTINTVISCCLYCTTVVCTTVTRLLVTQVMISRFHSHLKRHFRCYVVVSKPIFSVMQGVE